jgi:transcriptional regulator with XRE-family HTH domain
MMRFVRIRKELGVSQSKLARLADLHTTTVSQIETGHARPWPGQLRKIADALGWQSDPQALLEEVGTHDGD